MTPAYYNEFDKHAAQWLRNLIAAGLIAPGDVDERSITDVRPDDLRGYGQCHFFAGIGGWSYAMRLAGVPDDRPFWSGSCPCQPFSAAGKQRGSEDERHLWPAFFNLIRECRPGAVFGEQVAGAAGYAWWDHVASDLEGEGYAAAAADIGAHSIGAPHLRQRLYWVANTGRQRLQQFGGRDLAGAPERDDAEASKRQRFRTDARAGINIGRMANADSQQRGPAQGQPKPSHDWRDDSGRRSFDGERVGDAAGSGSQGGHESGQGAEAQRTTFERAGAFGNVGDATGIGLSRIGWSGEAGTAKSSPWHLLEWLACSDGKARPTQPGLPPLVDGVSNGRVAVGRAIGSSGPALSQEQASRVFNRRGVLKGAGNAIVPQLAAAFVRAALC